MAGLTTAAKNIMLDAFAAAADFVSLHTADPGAGGSSEVTGGSPAYARKALTWSAAAAGSVSLSGTATIDVPAGTTVTHAGYWTLASGGVFLGSRPLPQSETFAGQGTYQLLDADETLT